MPTPRFEALAVVVICVIAIRRKAVVVICVIAVRLRHCNTSEPTASVSLVGVTSMDVVRTYVRTCYMCLKTEARRYRLNAGGKRNETENGNKTERNANGHTVLRTCNGNKTGKFFLNVP